MAAHDLVLDTPGQFPEPLFQPGAALRCVQAAPAPFQPPDHFRQRQGFGKDAGDGFGAAGAHQAVGVLAGGQTGEAQAVAGGEDRQHVFRRPPRRPGARRVTVKTEIRLGRITPQQPHLILGQGGAERRHRVAEPGLIEGDDIGITLDHDDGAFGAGVFRRFRQAIKIAPFLEQRRFRRVQIFGLALAQDAPAEGDCAAAPVADRKHDAPAKPVIGRPPASIGLDQKPGLDHRGI